MVAGESLSSDRWPELELLFDAVLERDPEERGTWIADHCSGDPAMRRELEILVRAAESLGDFLEEPPSTRIGVLDGRGEEFPLIGTTVGRWRLIGPLGRGGMGDVYVGRRADGAFEMKAAVKLVPTALASADLRRRFRRERSILASLEHPGIARLVDGGVTGEGLPYLVMELVEGEPIDSYCDRLGLPLGKRLEMLVEVAKIVEYAHGQLVVHRDIKPSNIMVSSDGSIKLLDFGIATLIAGGAPAPAVTFSGILPLTPEYAAPEQINGGTIGVTTDVHGLGALAYKLVTGSAPYSFEKGRVFRGGPDRAGPAVPSRVLEPGPPRRRVAGDLDALLLKALAPRAEDRYHSVGELISDLEGYLEGRPLAARPAPVPRRMVKFLGRHRLGAAAALLALVGLGSLLWGVERQAVLAERARERAQEVSAFFAGVLLNTDPDHAQGVDVSLVTVLDNSTRAARTQLLHQPDLEADVLEVFAQSYARLDRLKRAIRVEEEALAIRRGAHREPDRALMETLLAAADIHSRTKQPADLAPSLELARQALSIARRVSGVGSLDEARALKEEAAVLDRCLPRRDPRVSERTRLLEQARRVFSARGDSDDLADTLHLLASHARRPVIAEERLRQALEMLQRLHGTEDRRVSGLMNDLALVVESRGDRDGAIHLLRRALAIHRRVLGPRHPQTMTIENNLAGVLRDAGRFAEAEPLYREVDDYNKATYPPGHPRLAFSGFGLGRVLLGEGQFERAEPPLRRALRILEENHDTGLAAVTKSALGECLWRSGKKREGRRLIENGAIAVKEAFGEEAMETARAEKRRELLAERGGK